MDKIYRKGVDVEIAFISGARKILNNQQFDLVNKETNPPDLKSPVTTAYPKKFLRAIARPLYRLLKPFFRPIAFRLRRYLNQELQQISNLLQKMQTQSDNLSTRLDHIEQYSYTTARREIVAGNTDETLVRTNVGYVLCPASDYLVIANLLESGDVESGTRQLIERLLSPGDLFIDIGANLGLHTLAAARAMEGRGSIIAFEPFPSSKHLLEKTIWINGFSKMMQIYQAAVSNTTGQQLLYLGKTCGHHSLFPLEKSERATEDAIEVSLVRLDDIISLNQKIDLIKISVEGAEMEVLQSTRTLIDNNPDIALIVDFCPSHIKRAAHSVPDWFKAFNELGLSYQVINALTGKLENWSMEQLKKTNSVNLFFSRAKSTAWLKADTPK